MWGSATHRDTTVRPEIVAVSRRICETRVWLLRRNATTRGFLEPNHGLKNRWGKPREGSTPSPGTTIYLRLCTLSRVLSDARAQWLVTSCHNCTAPSWSSNAGLLGHIADALARRRTMPELRFHGVMRGPHIAVAGDLALILPSPAIVAGVRRNRWEDPLKELRPAFLETVFRRAFKRPIRWTQSYALRTLPP